MLCGIKCQICSVILLAPFEPLEISLAAAKALPSVKTGSSSELMSILASSCAFLPVSLTVITFCSPSRRQRWNTIFMLTFVSAII